MFCASALLTTIFYILTTVKVAAVVQKLSGDSKAPRAILKRGLMLTFTFVLTWIMFVALGGIAYTENVIDINTDMIGAIIVNAQPTIDTLLLVSLPNVRADYLTRWSRQSGLAAVSS